METVVSRSLAFLDGHSHPHRSSADSYRRKLFGKIVEILSLARSSFQQARCGYVVLILTVYWVFEAIPLPVTSLLPLALFPMVKRTIETAMI